MSFSHWDEWKSNRFVEKAEFVPLVTAVSLPTVSAHDRPVRREDLTGDQVSALLEVMGHISDLKKEPGVVTLGGFAGTGKSTLIPLIAEQWGGAESIAFASPTGKAVNVMRRKLAAVEVPAVAMLGTVHSLIYTPIYDEHKRAIGFARRPPPLVSVYGREVHQVIIDEASMVGAQMLQDLVDMELQVLAVGDHGQLPPVGDQSVILDPHVRLETIHRQAEGNPIIRLAEEVRTTGRLKWSHANGQEIQYCPYYELHDRAAESRARLGLDSVTLVRRNKPRMTFNNLSRLSNRGPVPGDVVICLRNSAPVYNGMRGILEEVRPYKEHWWLAAIRFPDDGVLLEGLVNRYQFGAEKTLDNADALRLRVPDYPERMPLGLLFDFGYALTVHKSQGSAFEEVFLCPDRWSEDSDEDYARWLYTAVTRASKRLTIVTY